MLNETLVLQVLLIISLFYFTSTFNITTIWYLAGIYLTLLGWWLLLDDGDIFVGFLWVIDLGVGLVFFVFILHYSSFLHQKSAVNRSSREYSFLAVAAVCLLSIFLFVSAPSTTLAVPELLSTWLFSVSWYDYYDFFYSPVVTDLNLLHEVYFTTNSLEFLLINFLLLYGVIACVLASFLIKRIFNLLNYSQLLGYSFLTHARSTYFIRTQDHLKQQATSTGTRVWSKKRGARF